MLKANNSITRTNRLSYSILNFPQLVGERKSGNFLNNVGEEYLQIPNVVRIDTPDEDEDCQAHSPFK